MILGIIRHSYTTTIRLRKNDPSSDIQFTYEKAKPGAKNFPGKTFFHVRYSDSTAPFRGVGEVPGTRRKYHHPATTCDAPGLRYIGQLDWFWDGLPANVRLNRCGDA